MIIKINFKNNDFEEEMKKYMEKFSINILYDLSYKNVLDNSNKLWLFFY